ncbi:MAG TPA: hypothetical protein VM841_14720 [Actinomycetota bacterium]|nr:hypothetical protein [Actinomycetota bacterium]
MKRFALVALIALAACSGDPSVGDRASPRASSPPPAAASSPATAMEGRTGGSPSPGTAPGAGVAPSAQASASTVAASLARPCVPAGQTQTMTVTGLKPNEVTGYSTQYSDGSNELTNKSYTSGFGNGVAGPNGRYETTWVVPAAAPAGRAEVLVIWASGTEPLRVSFMIPAGGQGC